MFRLIFKNLIIFSLFYSYSYAKNPIVDTEETYSDNTELLLNNIESVDESKKLFDDDNEGRYINVESISSEESYLLNSKEAINKYEAENLLKNKDTLVDIKDQSKSKIILKKQNQKRKDTPYGYRDSAFTQVILSSNAIKLSSPYEFKKTYVSKKAKRFLFDFYLDKDFKPKQRDLYHEYFKAISLKSYSAEQFFRVTLFVTKPVKNYKVYFKGKDIMVEYVAPKKLKTLKSYEYSK